MRDALVRAALREAFDGVRECRASCRQNRRGSSDPREARALGESVGRLPGVTAALATLADGALSMRTIRRGTRAVISPS